jgi:hypothetical protein
MEILANTLGCSIGSMHFTYLGLPLGITKPKVIDFLPLISKCERRLACTSMFLSQVGRLQMTNIVFTSLSTFNHRTFKLHKIVIKQIDKYRKIVCGEGLMLMSKHHPMQLGKWFVCLKKRVD